MWRRCSQVQPSYYRTVERALLHLFLRRLLLLSRHFPLFRLVSIHFCRTIVFIPSSLQHQCIQ